MMRKMYVENQLFLEDGCNFLPKIYYVKNDPYLLIACKIINIFGMNELSQNDSSAKTVLKGLS